jgi:anti-sigma regulatory factor (Ser/Thr protein kinase)
MFFSGDTRTRNTPIPCPRSTSRRGLLALPSERERVGTARRFTNSLLRSWEVPEEGRDSAVLIVDELTANAATHGHADTTLVVALEDGVVLIAVTDSGAPVAHPPLAECEADEHGRGTHIVDFLAQRVHVRLDGEGCRVSVALRVAPEAPVPQG